MGQVITILIDGVTYASWLFIVALGLTLVFGVLKILNFAHGSFYALGAYAAASFVSWFATLQLAPSLSLVDMSCGWCRPPVRGRSRGQRTLPASLCRRSSLTGMVISEPVLCRSSVANYGCQPAVSG